jgi:hypothetical protein
MTILMNQGFAIASSRCIILVNKKSPPPSRGGLGAKELNPAASYSATQSPA